MEIIEKFEGHCPSCKGSGEVEMRGQDGEPDYSDTCPYCNGKGLTCKDCGQPDSAVALVADGEKDGHLVNDRHVCEDCLSSTKCGAKFQAKHGQECICTKPAHSPETSHSGDEITEVSTWCLSKYNIVRGGRTGKETHYASTGSSSLACGIWVQASSSYFKVNTTEVTCKKCLKYKEYYEKEIEKTKNYPDHFRMAEMSDGTFNAQTIIPQRKAPPIVDRVLGEGKTREEALKNAVALIEKESV